MVNKTLVNKEKLLASSIKKRSFEYYKHETDADIAKMIVFAEHFLTTPDWFKLKADAISQMGIKCMRCKKMPKLWSQINVDHIKPRKYFPSLADKMSNLQILCGYCNKSKGNKHDMDYRNQNV
jgi:thymidine kinase